MYKLIFILLISTMCHAQIEQDKKLHFGSGALISGVTNIALLSVKKDSKNAFWIGLGMSILAGVSKELYDKNRGGKFDCTDLAYTVGGGLVGSIVVNLTKKKNKAKIF